MKEASFRYVSIKVKTRFRQVSGKGKAKGRHHTVDYDPFIKNQLVSMQLILGPYVLQTWSRNPQNFEATKPSKSTVWKGSKDEPGTSRRAHR